jgi:transposase
VIDQEAIRLRFEALDPLLDERGRRRYAAAEALAAGHGGISAVSQITGVARSTIGRGLVELRDGATAEPDRVRRPGGGRKPLTVKDATLIDDLRGLLEPSTRGDPQAALLWTAKSLRNLAAGLRELGHQISYSVVGELLRSLGYSLQANRKTREGASHPDRDAQFGYINEQVKAALAAGEPAISVDTKKKELVGDFKNVGREWRPKGSPEPVRVHDFLIKQLGRAVPYGVYDIGENAGWVSVGVDHGELRGQRHPPLVADHGTGPLPQCQESSDHCGWRRQQWGTAAFVEARVAELDPNPYDAGITVNDAELAAVNLTRHDFHGEWNYTIAPKALSLER